MLVLPPQRPTGKFESTMLPESDGADGGRPPVVAGSSCRTWPRFSAYVVAVPYAAATTLVPASTSAVGLIVTIVPSSCATISRNGRLSGA